LPDPGFLLVGELAGVLVAGLVAGGPGVVERAQGGVPVGFQRSGDEPVGGIDGQVTAASRAGGWRVAMPVRRRGWLLPFGSGR
jgi:hypothetical protein